MYHNRVICLVDFLIPHLLKDFIGAEDPPRIGCQQIQDVKFDRRQLDLLAVHRHFMIIFVDRESLDRDLIFNLVSCTALRI